MKKHSTTNCIRITLLVAFLVLQSTTLSYCQKNNSQIGNVDNWAFGFNVGFLHYYSKANNPYYPGFEITLAKKINPIFGFQGNLLAGRLYGESPLYRFQSKVLEANLNATVNLSNLWNGKDRNQLMNFYALAGLGLNNFDGSTFEKSTGLVYRQFGFNSGRGIKGYQVNGMANIGVGMVCFIDYQFKIILESDIKIMKYAALAGPEAVSALDGYNYTSIGIVYQLPFAKKFHWKCQE